ncbi:hypothetical protein JNUCC23_02075 [Peribacillus sp. JNUCC 23]
MVYRPTVRYTDVYKDYVEEVFKATDLDRNQIFRLALFTAVHSKEYKTILKKHLAADVPLPHPHWGLDEEDYWKDQNYIKKEKPLNDSDKIFINTGGIKIVIG